MPIAARRGLTAPQCDNGDYGKSSLLRTGRAASGPLLFEGRDEDACASIIGARARQQRHFLLALTDNVAYLRLIKIAASGTGVKVEGGKFTGNIEIKDVRAGVQPTEPTKTT